jgi:hypothetical protein
MKNLILAIGSTMFSLLAFGLVLIFYGSLFGVLGAAAYWVFRALT